MKHVKTITRTPGSAQDPTIGQILSLVASILGLIGQTLVAKEGGTVPGTQ